jgi:maltose/moltooligosaccharide transporter
VLLTILSTKEYPPNESERQRLAHAKKFDVAALVQAAKEMPATMRQLAAVQFLSWLGLFCMFLYFAVAVARNVFGASSTADPAYTQGVIWAGYCSGLYNTVCFLFAPMLPVLAQRFGKKQTHAACLAAGAIGFFAISLIHNKWLLFLPMVGVGIAWASILAMPYSILSNALPANRMGVYMGIFNFFIVLPEILSALFFGPIMSHALNNDRMKALVIGGFCFAAAALLALRVREVTVKDEVLVPTVAA